jgi:hypothetical protein
VETSAVDNSAHEGLCPLSQLGVPSVPLLDAGDAATNRFVVWTRGCGLADSSMVVGFSGLRSLYCNVVAPVLTSYKSGTLV